MFKILKCFLVILISVFLFSAFCFLNKSPVLSGEEKFFVYTNHGSSSNGTIINEKYFPFIKNVNGESYLIEKKDFSVQEFFSRLNGKILFTEETLEGISYYGFSSKIKYGEKINGKKVNIHVYVCEDFIKAGFPIIYGAY